jgi:prepilin-type N-terminal cleavage/methylation domain-containing protein
MSERNEQGFTLVEVIVAIVLLGVGVMALVSSSAMATRMIGRGKESTMAAQIGAAQVERLRQLGASTSPNCTAALFKSDSLVDGTSHVRARWVVPTAGTTRSIQVFLTYRAGSKQVVDTMLTTIYCPA